MASHSGKEREGKRMREEGGEQQQTSCLEKLSSLKGK